MLNEPIRVLNIVGEMSPGGIEVLIMNIYRNLDRNKVQFDFLMHSPDGENSFVPEIEELGGRIYRGPIIKTPIQTHYDRLFEYIIFLKKFFKEHQEYHIIHGHMTNTAAIYMPIARKYGKVTCLIAHSHLTQARPGLVGKITDILQKPIPKLATNYFACSEMAAHWIFPDELINSGKVKIIKNGVDSKCFQYNTLEAIEIKERLGLKGKYVIGNVARFKLEKNHSFMIDIIQELVKVRDDIILMLIGDGELRQETETKVKMLGLDNYVMFMGIRSDVPKLMEAMDMFLLPSLYEGLPVAGIEAQAAGLPVITSTNVTREMDITGNVTFLDLNESTDIWVDKINEIYSSFERKDMLLYIRENGYDITETAKWLEEFYLDNFMPKENHNI